MKEIGRTYTKNSVKYHVVPNRIEVDNITLTTAKDYTAEITETDSGYYADSYEGEKNGGAIAFNALIEGDVLQISLI